MAAERDFEDADGLQDLVDQEGEEETEANDHLLYDTCMCDALSGFVRNANTLCVAFSFSH